VIIRSKNNAAHTTLTRYAKSHAIERSGTQARQFHIRTGKHPIPAIGTSPLQLTPHTPFTLASIIGRAAFRATRPLRASGINSGAENAASAASREADKNALKQGARKDPELYVRRHCLCALPDTQKDVANKLHTPMLLQTLHPNAVLPHQAQPMTAYPITDTTAKYTDSAHHHVRCFRSCWMALLA
jgi:hypothetical protein